MVGSSIPERTKHKRSRRLSHYLIWVVCGFATLFVFRQTLGLSSLRNLDAFDQPIVPCNCSYEHSSATPSANLLRKYAATTQHAQNTKSKPLNVLILYPDDMRHDSLSCAGTQLVQTPFLDQLASWGIRFTHNCVTTSICWISRATLFTGQYLARHRSGRLFKTVFYDNWNTTWPYLLQKEKGYYVGHIGKWQFRNLGFVIKAFNWTRLFEGVHWHNINGTMIHTSDYTAQSAIDFLRERPKDRPFAATVAFYPPKGINSKQFFNPKPESLALYANATIPPPFDHNASFLRLPRAVYTKKNLARETWFHSFGDEEKYQKNMKDMYRMITEVDEACRTIVEELKNQGILDETLVIFTTDNGMIHGEHGLAGKWIPYQESIRVPLIVWDPRIPDSKRGTTDDSFTLNIDLASTILGAAQIDVPAGMQGRDISSLYRTNDSVQSNGGSSGGEAKTPWREEFYYEHPSHGGENRIPKSSALVRKDFKYMKYDNFGIESFFHLASDPMEQNDILDNPVFASKLEDMRKRYDELKTEVEKPPPYEFITL